jgi:hypothetical protein
MTQLNNKLSLSQSLLIFYITVASSFTKGLFNNQMITHIENNRLVQHVIAYILLLVILNTFGGIENIEKTVMYSLIGYIWFILTTKLDIQINIIIVIILLIGYIYENKLNQKEDELENDKILSKYDKLRIKYKHKQIKMTIIIITVGITLIGTFLYGNKQLTQHTIQNGGCGFSLVKYLLD